MENKKKSKSKILIMLFAIVLLVVGASFAIWHYSYSGTEENVLSSPDLSLRFLESNNEVISIDNGVPMKDEDGIKQSGTGNVFDFEVKSKALMDTDISYDINLEKLSIDSGKTALSDSDIKVYVEDFNGNTVLKPTKVSDLSNYKLFTKVHRHSKSNNEISTKYKLKVWIDENVDVFSLEGKQYKFRVGVSTNQKEQDKNQTYSLVYNLDGGTGSITDSTFKVGDKVTISSTVPVKAGYKFLGWSTKKSASSASYKAGEEVTLNDAYDGKVTLYAVWQGKTYTVKYDSNGGTGSMDDSVFKLATDVRLSSNKFTKENYTFIGWSTSKGGEVTYTNEAKVKDLGGEGDIVTLYAVWKSNTYTIKYDSNGGNGFVGESSYNYGNSIKLTKNKFTKDGYTFIGWNTNKDANAALYTDEQEVSGLSGNITLYAVWKVNEYNVNVTVQNGTVDVANKKVIEKQNGVFNLTPSNSNYNNASVSCTNDQTGIVKNNILTVSNVTKDTVCTVTYYSLSTVLYNDGTLILNEYSYNRESNITKHGSVTQEYAPMDESNSYVFSANSDRPWSGVANNVTSVIVGSEMEPTSTAYWFDSLYKMESGDFTNLNTSNVTNMRQMFLEAGLNSNKFSVFGLENWNTSKVTDMGSMFGSAGLSSTTWSIGDLSNWDVSNVTNMRAMFSSAGSFATTWSVGDLSSWDTSKVTNMSRMFQLAGSDATTFNLDLSKWDTSNVTDMSYMFDSAGKNATTFNLDLSNWDTSSVTNMGHIFSDAGSKATTWAVKIPKVTGSLRNTTSKWYGSSESVYAEPDTGKKFTLSLDVDVVVQDGALASGEISSKSGWPGDSFSFNIVPNDTSKVGVVSCTNDQTGIVKNNVLTVSNVTKDTVCTVTYYKYSTVLYNDGTLILNEYSYNRESNITKHGSVTQEYAPMDESNSYVFSANSDRPWSGVANNVTSVIVGSEMEPTSTAYWFDSLYKMESGDFTNLNTSSVTYMYYMFSSAGENATTWNIGDISNWDTSSVTDMTDMFSSAGENATTWNIGDISNWDTSSVTEMSSMFSSAGSSATTWNIGNLSNWNTSSVTNMSGMFSSAGSSATTFNLDLSSWNTSSVTDMTDMFFSAGMNATTWSVTIPKTTGSLTNTTLKWYGFSDSIYAEPCANKKFKIYYDVNVVVQNGTLNDDATKKVAYGSNVSFNVVPGDSSLYGSVECENGTVGFIKNNVLTLKDVKNSDTCTVSFGETRTILYENGTLVINELTSKIDEHSSLYGGVLIDYDPMSDSNSYVFDVPGSPLWGDALPSIKKVVIGSSIKPLSLAYWFHSGVVLESGDFYNLDTSETTSMKAMFAETGTDVIDEGNGFPDFILKGLDMWDTSKVTDFSGLFTDSGVNSTVWNVGDISNWDTSSATDMSNMFGSAGYSAEIFNLNLSRWDTSKVTNMSSMFIDTGHNSAIFNLDLSGWDTSKVTDMTYMFSSAGNNATTWSVKIPKNTGSLSNATDKFYGSSDSVYDEPPSGKSFTLAT